LPSSSASSSKTTSPAGCRTRSTRSCWTGRLASRRASRRDRPSLEEEIEESRSSLRVSVRREMDGSIPRDPGLAWANCPLRAPTERKPTVCVHEVPTRTYRRREETSGSHESKPSAAAPIAVATRSQAAVDKSSHWDPTKLPSAAPRGLRVAANWPLASTDVSSPIRGFRCFSEEPSGGHDNWRDFGRNEVRRRARGIVTRSRCC